MSNYKNYKNLFEKIKKNMKSMHYNSLFKKFQNDMTKTWKVIKEIIGKSKVVSNSLPRKVIVDELEICDQKTIPEKFNNFFVNVGPKLASKVVTPKNKYFTDYCLPSPNVLKIKN